MAGSHVSAPRFICPQFSSGSFVTPPATAAQMTTVRRSEDAVAARRRRAENFSIGKCQLRSSHSSFAAPRIKYLPRRDAGARPDAPGFGEFDRYRYSAPAERTFHTSNQSAL